MEMIPGMCPWSLRWRWWWTSRSRWGGGWWWWTRTPWCCCTPQPLGGIKIAVTKHVFWKTNLVNIFISMCDDRDCYPTSKILFVQKIFSKSLITSISILTSPLCSAASTFLLCCEQPPFWNKWFKKFSNMLDEKAIKALKKLYKSIKLLQKKKLNENLLA